MKKTESVTEEAVQAFVNAEVADYKRLAGGIEFVTAIPKSGAGKILRKDLVAKWTSEQQYQK